MQLLIQKSGAAGRNCISDKLPGDADDAGPRPTLGASKSLMFRGACAFYTIEIVTTLRGSACLCDRCWTRCFLSSSSFTLHTSSARRA